MNTNYISLFLGSLFFFAIPNLHAGDISSEEYANDAGSEDAHDDLDHAVALFFEHKFTAARDIFAKYSVSESSKWPAHYLKIAIRANEEAIEEKKRRRQFLKENSNSTTKIIKKGFSTRVGSRYTVVRDTRETKPLNDVTNNKNASDE